MTTVIMNMLPLHCQGIQSAWFQIQNREWMFRLGLWVILIPRLKHLLSYHHFTTSLCTSVYLQYTSVHLYIYVYIYICIHMFVYVHFTYQIHMIYGNITPWFYVFHEARSAGFFSEEEMKERDPQPWAERRGHVKWSSSIWVFQRIYILYDTGKLT